MFAFSLMNYFDRTIMSIAGPQIMNGVRLRVSECGSLEDALLVTGFPGWLTTRLLEDLLERPPAGLREIVCLSEPEVAVRLPAVAVTVKDGSVATLSGRRSKVIVWFALAILNACLG